MGWQEKVNGDPLTWLLEIDPVNPGVRWFALTELEKRPLDDPEVVEVKQLVMRSGPVPIILDAQDPEGYWVKPGPGYGPKYRATIWQLVFLAQFGADGNDPRVHAGCSYVLEHSRSPYGGLSMNGANSGLIHCMQGNVAAGLIDLGWWGDERLQEAIDWLARSITGEGIALSKEKAAPVRYYRSGNSGPGFHCSANDHLPCAWGAVKAMLALSKVPKGELTSSIQAAIDVGIDFLLGVDPATAMYPMGYNDKPNRSWFKFGYPIGYVTDVLQILEVLTALGCGADPRLENALELVLNKQDEEGRWRMEYTYNGKTWVDIEEKKKPSKWVTLRALRVLKRVNSI